MPARKAAHYKHIVGGWTARLPVREREGKRGEAERSSSSSHSPIKGRLNFCWLFPVESHRLLGVWNCISSRLFAFHSLLYRSFFFFLLRSDHRTDGARQIAGETPCGRLLNTNTRCGNFKCGKKCSNAKLRWNYDEKWQIIRELRA